MGFVRMAEAATSQIAASASGIAIDWTINVGHMISVVVFIGGAVFALLKLQWKLKEVSDDIDQFRAGLENFQDDFKAMGTQVVGALVAIARLEGKSSSSNESRRDD